MSRPLRPFFFIVAKPLPTPPPLSGHATKKKNFPYTSIFFSHFSFPYLASINFPYVHISYSQGCRTWSGYLVGSSSVSGFLKRLWSKSGFPRGSGFSKNIWPGSGIGLNTYESIFPLKISLSSQILTNILIRNIFLNYGNPAHTTLSRHKSFMSLICVGCSGYISNVFTYKKVEW